MAVRSKTWLMVLPLILAIGAGSCRKSITYPTHRRPVITSVVAFPTTLGPGDSTLITIHASDPDGDRLVYDWHSVNGLRTRNDNDGFVFSAPDPSMVFYRFPSAADTAWVWCTARDERGGSDTRRVVIFFQN